MCKLHINPTTGQLFQVQKRIQAVLVERGLQPFKGVRLECEKPKCTTCQFFSTWTVCIKRRKYDTCKKAKDHSSHCTKQHIYDACDLQKKSCQCVIKKYCIRCKEISLLKLCLECAKISPKCTLEGQYLFKFTLTNILLFLLYQLFFLFRMLQSKNSFYSTRFFITKISY